MWVCAVDRNGDEVEHWYGITERDAFEQYLKSNYVLSRVEQLVIYYEDR
jgi:hypothetical protein